MPKIIIYSTTTCPYCKLLKDYLIKCKLEYKEKLVDQDEAAQKEMSDASGGFMGVPFTVIHLDDGRKETVIGFDKKRIDEILGIGDRD